MAVPRNRLSNARRNSKRAHHAKTPKLLKACENCGKEKLPHHICGACGAYGNKIVISAKS